MVQCKTLDTGIEITTASWKYVAKSQFRVTDYIELRAMELSDIISFHCYQPVHDVVGIIEALKEDYDFNGYPYDKTEIELIQQLSKMADEKFEVKKHK